MIKALLSIGWLTLIANEIRGALMATPILYGMWLSGGDAMALWLGFCSLAGIAISVAAPLVAYRHFTRKVAT